MAKDKESRSINPATAALKASKQRNINKQKAAVAQQRNERLSKRNPERVRSQIEDLKQQREASGGVLNARDKKRLEELERDVGRIERAKEKFGGGSKEEDGARRDVRREQRERREGVLGKRSRGTDDIKEPDDDVNGFRNRHSGSNVNKRQRTPESETDEEAKSIPMPKDIENMPPIPRKMRKHHDLPNRPGQGEVPVLPAQTVYSSAPQLRNLHKEAVSRFVPAAVATKLAAVRGEGGKLLEPEEADALEAAGYHAITTTASNAKESRNGEETGHVGVSERDVDMEIAAERAVGAAEKEVEYRLMAREAQEGEADTLDEEARRFEQELRHVEMEEVSDEDL